MCIMVKFNITGAVTLIVGILLVLVIASQLIPEAQDSSTQFNASNTCATVDCYYNHSFNGGVCQAYSNGTNYTVTPCANEDVSVPLTSLFTGSGIVFVLIAVFILILVIGAVGLNKLSGKK